MPHPRQPGRLPQAPNFLLVAPLYHAGPSAYLPGPVYNPGPRGPHAQPEPGPWGGSTGLLKDSGLGPGRLGPVADCAGASVSSFIKSGSRPH